MVRVPVTKLGTLCCLLFTCTFACTLAQAQVVTLLFTNDLESAYDPVEAWWRDDTEQLGGIAQLATLISQTRAAATTAFLFDAGDIFTGTLAKRTRGAVAFDLMSAMDYDAMVIGNHEFEYGWQVLAKQKNRVAFPVLGANLFYKDTQHPFAQPWAIIERNGVRVGVIGVMGRDAATALIPSNIAGLDVHDPVEVVRQHVNTLRAEVDLIVVLTHQGPTAPMQTDKEADPEVQRGNAANLALAGAVPGIDVIFGGHTDAGTPEPLRHPDTGTVVMQTFGQGQNLGWLQIDLSGKQEPQGKLIHVRTRSLEPDPTVSARLAQYRQQHPDLYQVAGSTTLPMTRRYYRESSIGSLLADILAQASGAPIGLMPSGALRKDLPGGEVRKVDLLDTFPFEDRVGVVEVSGALLKQIIEQGLSLERGILQVSGLQVEYNPIAPAGERITQLLVQGQPVKDQHTYQVATLEILVQGGDSYIQFTDARLVRWLDQPYSQVLTNYFRDHPNLQPPASGRLVRTDG